MKRVLLIDKDEANVFLLRRLEDEGCEVALLTPNQGSISTHFLRPASGQEALRWNPDYVICCSSGFGSYLKRFREQGCQVIGGGTITDKFDNDVGTALAYLDAAKVPTCDYELFTDVATAVDYVIDNDKPWRLVMSNRESYGFSDGMELATDLEKRSSDNLLPSQFIVHRDFPGIESGELCMWSSFHVTGFIHEKGLMNPCFAVALAKSSVGIPTCEGVTMFPIPTNHPIVQLTLARLASGLGKIGYCGPVTLGCLVQPGEYSEDEPHSWEDRICVHNMTLTAPDGFWAAFLGGLEMPLHFFLDRLLSPARANNPFDFWEGVVSSRKLTVPPYPITEAPWLSGNQLKTIQELIPTLQIPYKPDILWNGTQPGPDGSMEILHPVLGYLTGKASRASDSLRQIREEFDHLKIPYAQICDQLGDTYEVDMLPTGLASRQLDWDAESKEDNEKEPEVAYAG